MSAYDRTPNGYVIKINVNGFEQDEVQIQTDDRYVVVTGEHEERLEDGSKYLVRHFVQRFLMPLDVTLQDLTTNISDEGILIIRLPIRQNSSQGQDKENSIEEDNA